MDGVLADFASAYHDVEARLFGPRTVTRAGSPEEESIAREGEGAAEPGPGDAPPDAAPADASALEATRELRRRRDVIWQAIRETPDFWTSLTPTREGAVRRIHEMMLRHRWEVFFITQRPKTEGDTVQRQTQRWLVAQGFDLPSVLVIPGSRGGVAAALALDYHVDDSPKNCVDIRSDSNARPILIVDTDDEMTARSARKLGIASALSIDACLDILDQASLARTEPGLLSRLAQMIGWK